MNPPGVEAPDLEPGVERFDTYVSRCLYGPSGFYTVGGVAGRRGDFITSPEVGPLFGLLLSRLLERWWKELGQPEAFSVYDVGTGPGTLVTSLRSAIDARPDPWDIQGVDLVGPSAQNELPTDLTGSVVIANELLDNMAFRVVEHRSPGEWYEVYVDVNGPGQPQERLVSIEPLDLDIPVGTRGPWHQQAQNWVSDILAAGVERLLIIDYGVPSTATLAGRGGWLRTYANHARGNDPYLAPGTCDITTDIAFDQLPKPNRMVSQTELLRDLGIDQLVEEGRRYWTEHAAAPTVEALKMRSRISEAEALCDPSSLGSWLAAVWSRSE